MVEADVARSKGGAGVRKRGQVASDLRALGGGAGCQPAGAAQPGDEGDEPVSDKPLTAREHIEAAAELELDAIHAAPQFDQVVANRGIGETVDILRFEVANEGLGGGRTHVCTSVPSSNRVSRPLTGALILDSAVVRSALRSHRYLMVKPRGAGSGSGK